MSGDLNELLDECKARGVNHKDAFWLRAHLAQFDDLAYWDMAKIRAMRPVRNRLMLAVDCALYAPLARFA